LIPLLGGGAPACEVAGWVNRATLPPPPTENKRRVLSRETLLKLNRYSFPLQVLGGY